ncbi:MAG TPA: 2-phospho-L-lactate guanylyltransferase [Candidatus Binataceae bacterium]|nr:2-phospho-L-lactate guanylyltransferase [Candidatus Binataceae bacterium]
MRAILIAAKHLAFAKTRLGRAIGDRDRMALAEAMFRDVLAAALSARAADHVAVISSDQGLLAMARAAGALVIDEEFPRGLNAAVRLATAALSAQGVESLCTVLSDIPLVTGADIDSVFSELGEEGSGVALVPSRDLSGTNIIARAPADAIATRFGSQSLRRHLEECYRLGLPSRVVRQRGPALDLDVIEDLNEFVRTPSVTHTYSQLARLGLAQG